MIIDRSRTQIAPTCKNVTKPIIEAIRQLSPIDIVAREYIQLRQSGIQLLGRCPFHDDKNPSFFVHPAKGVYRCHGCCAGGDVFNLVSRLHGCSFLQAVRILAGRAGVRVEGFKVSPELAIRVAAIRRQREQDAAFERFCSDRISTINSQHRRLGRSAIYAEDCLLSGEQDPVIHDLAWNALERFQAFEARVERERLVDLSVLRIAWQSKGEHHAAS